MAFDFYSLFIYPLENNSIIVKYLGLSLELIVPPHSFYFVTIFVHFWEFFIGFGQGR